MSHKTTNAKPIVCLVTSQELVTRSWVLQDAEILTSMGLGVTYVTIGSPLPTPLSLLAFVKQLKRILSSRVMFGWFAYPTTLFLGKALGKPTVLNAVGHEVALYPDFGYGLPSWWYARALIRIALRSADYVIAISRESARWAETWGAKHVVVIYEGISTSKFKCNRTGRRSSHKGPIVLTAAYLGADNIVRKDFATLFRAMKQVFDVVPGTKLIIVGEKMNGYPLLVETARELGISHAIAFKGFLQFSDYMKILRDASVFVMPSLHEGFPTALCEALSCGVPVVTTDRPTMNEVFANNVHALLVEAKNPQKLAEAMISVLTDKNLASRIADNGRRLVEKNYSTQARTEKLAQLFQTVLTDIWKPNRSRFSTRMTWLIVFVCLCLITPVVMLTHRLTRRRKE